MQNLALRFTHVLAFAFTLVLNVGKFCILETYCCEEESQEKDNIGQTRGHTLICVLVGLVLSAEMRNPQSWMWSALAFFCTLDEGFPKGETESEGAQPMLVPFAFISPSSASSQASSSSTPLPTQSAWQRRKWRCWVAAALRRFRRAGPVWSQTRTGKRRPRRWTERRTSWA